MVALLTAMIGAALVGPAVLTPTRSATAYASVYGSCTSSRCADAQAARDGWQRLGLPTARGWYYSDGWYYSASGRYNFASGGYNFAGGRFRNAEGQLPSGATYHEYDVYPRAKGAPRDAYRIVVNRGTGATWFSPNHYTDFYRLS